MQTENIMSVYPKIKCSIFTAGDTVIVGSRFARYKVIEKIGYYVYLKDDRSTIKGDVRNLYIVDVLPSCEQVGLHYKQ